MATFMEILTWIRHCPGAEKIASRIVSGLFVFAFSIALVSTSAFGQIDYGEGNFTIRQPIASQMGDLPAHVLAEGAELEKSRRWGEALNVYQQALKKYPQNAELKQRRAVARIHYDLSRRYSDSSFVQTIGSTDGNTALNVYAEILLKVQSYYVDEPNWADLASYGLTSLEVALMSPEFRRINLTGVSDEQIRQTILTTRNRLSKVSVNNRHDAYIVASGTAKSLRDSLGLDVQATAYEFVCGAISALDPYSAFMSSNQFSETMSQIEGNFVGLGVELRTHPDHLEIVSVISGGSAGKGGLVKGDRIVGVDLQSVPEIGADRAADLMRGPEGSFVQITVERGQGPQTVNLERRRVEIPSVDHVGIVDAQAGVGYIRLTNFQKTTARDFDAALWKLHREGMRSLIVDVRGNPGGLLSASVDVADRFLNQGVIVSTRGRNPMEDFTHRANIANTWRLPLVVLVDENSASASEIFAAAIRDHNRGTIVGNQSYGKGSVQGIFPLNVSGGGVRLTTAKFYSPKGNAISEVGVKADVLVQESAKFNSETPTGEDNGLRIGIQTARRSQRINSPIQTNVIGQAQPHRPIVAGR
jgi:carboxyl-terminal processing protease